MTVPTLGAPQIPLPNGPPGVGGVGALGTQPGDIAALLPNGANLLQDQKFRTSLLSWADGEYSKCKQARYSIERQWYYNLAFYYGKQYVQTIKTGAVACGYKLVEPKAPPWRVRIVVNKVRTMVRTEVAKLTSMRPTFIAIPATNEDEDQAAARVVSQIFESAYYDDEMQIVLGDAAWWLSICGVSFIKTYWDPNKRLPRDAAPGAIQVDAVSPFQIYVPNFMEKELEKQPYVLHVVTKPKEEVKKLYGVEISSKATITSVTDLYETAWMDLSGQNLVNKEQVLIKEFWVRPGATSLLPQGGMFTIVGDQLVELVMQSPYKHGTYPFSKLDHIPTGKFYSDSVITDVIPLQREYNRTISQLIEAKNTMSKPKLMAARGSIDPSKVTNDPGQIIMWNPGFPEPKPMPLTPMPEYVVNQLDRIQQDMDDVSGQHEISRGQNPSEVTAATAISFLQEQDDTKLGPTVHSIERALTKIGKQYLSLISQYWDEERMIRVVGKDGTFSAIHLQKNMMNDNTDIRVQAGSAMPYSKAARQSFIMELLKMGVIPPDKVLPLLDLKGIEKVTEDYMLDVREAQRENIKLSEGTPSNPMQWNNHQVHIQIHNNFRKTQEFETLPEEVKVMFAQHIEIHQQAMYMNMQPGGAMAQTGPIQPGQAPQEQPQPGGPPQGSPPQG